MKKLSIFLIFLIFILILIPFAHANNINGVIFRANVNEMYIEGQTIPIQVQALYFQNSVPQSTSISIYVKIENLTSNEINQYQFNVSSGIAEFIYLPALPVGLYDFIAYASAYGQNSQIENMEFLVAPPPVPYYATFVSGGLFHFHSEVLNRTGHYDSNYSFTIDIYYQYPGGAAEMVESYHNVTNLTIQFPDDGQIVVINIIDKYGWVNGMNIDPSEGIFSGTPYTYNFNMQNQQPFYSVYAGNFIPDILAIGIITLFILLIYERRIKR